MAGFHQLQRRMLHGGTSDNTGAWRAQHRHLLTGVLQGYLQCLSDQVALGHVVSGCLRQRSLAAEQRVPNVFQVQSLLQ